MRLPAPMVAGRPLPALAAHDEALYCALYGNPQVMRHVGAALPPARARAAFASVMAQLGVCPPRAAYWLLPGSVSSTPGDPAVGLMALQPGASDGHRAEVGVLLPPEAQGGGVASAAIAALADVVFAESALQVLWTRHAECHLAATALMRGLGFQPAPQEREGELRWELPRTRWLRLRDAAMARKTAGGWIQPLHSGEVVMSQRGSLACVGIGMMLGAHIGARARATIERADVVFMAVSDPLVELWLRGMHRDVRSLQPCYGGGRSRLQAYAEMVALMLAEVRAGHRVCGAFYGHPGVFAVAPHQAIAQARAEGYEAYMEPGISAEDCLYADLGLDPGTTGCQHFEAGQFLRYRRQVDRGALLVLWQVGMAVSGPGGRQLSMGAWQRLLSQRLLQDYPEDHHVTLYEAATLAVARPRIEGMPLTGVAGAELRPQTTLVLPPSSVLQPDRAMLDLIAGIEAGESRSATILSTV